MKVFTSADLRQLIDVHSDTCISLYMPSSPLGAYKQQSMLHLKNLIKRTEQHLFDKGMRSREADDLLAPVKHLLKDHSFWDCQSNGLALFLTGREFFYYRLPVNFSDLIYIDEHFYLKPLLSLLNATGRYFVLALSLNQARVFEANRYNIRPIRLMELPEGIEKHSALRQSETSLQFHTRSATAVSGRREALYHGQGSMADEYEKEIHQYLKAVDRAVCRALDYQRIPLILAGVDNVISAYRRLSRYHNLLEAALEGNPERLQDHQIREWSWPLVKEQFNRQEDQAIEEYYRLQPAQKSTADPETILAFAFQGEVDTIFLRQEAALWGMLTPDGRLIESRSSRGEHDKDLLDEAAYRTLSHNGRVFVLPPAKMPQQAMMTANLRLKFS